MILNLTGEGRIPKLFCSREIRTYFGEREAALKREVDALPEAQLAQVDESAWAGALAEKYAIAVPEIDPERAEIELGEEDDLPPAQFQNAMFMLDPYDERTVRGRRSSLHIPFKGDAEIFQMQGSSFGGRKPIGEVVGAEVVHPIAYPNGMEPDFKARKDQFVEEMHRELSWLRSDVESFNARLGFTAMDAIQKRRGAFRAAMEAVGKSGIPMRSSSKVPVKDVLVRRPRPHALPRNLHSAIELDPAMKLEIFDDIVGLVKKAGQSMETSPGAFQLGEEDLRHQIRAMLNTHYTDVSGEAFTFKGKSDLLVRVEGQHVFVGECKFWDGPKEFTATIDQLSERYSSWRDVRLCAIIFVKAKGLTDVLRKGRETLEQHPRFVKIVSESEDGGIRGQMRWPGDDQRIVTLHVVFVHLPDPA